MKKLLFLLLGWGVLGASPVWINRGDPVPTGLIRVKLNPTLSMYPVLKGTEWVHYDFSGEPKVGDFAWILRAYDHKMVLHEITALNKRAMLTSGRANRFNDGWSPRENLVAICRFVERPELSASLQVR